MGLRTGTSSPSEGMARLGAVPYGYAGGLTAGVEDKGEAQDVREGLALLRDAAALGTASQRLDGLLLQLTVNPFDSTPYRGLSSHLVDPGVLALAAHKRVTASTVPCI